MTGRLLRQGEGYYSLESFLPRAPEEIVQGLEEMFSVGNALTASLPEWMRPVTSQQDISQMTASVPQSDTEQKQRFKNGLARVTTFLPSGDTQIEGLVDLGIVSRLRERPMTMAIEELADGPVPTSAQDSSREETILHLQYSLIQAYKSLQAGNGFAGWLSDVKIASGNMERHWESPTSHDRVPSEDADLTSNTPTLT